ncbi:helix-turn-helix domain-containing protein [Ornithinimicrobium avium]|uniref:XRE family transcriptional regulator n=1 Tax=Ornithinimicrobium avium TaxID=2283195 RepID=A0A345NLW8_9MICO|nr:XRE family transcriptional regulator [Ornithinimicrobium avium]
MDRSESGVDGKAYARVPLDVHRLRDLRLRKGWTQHTLSVMVGVQGAAAVSAWERGLAVPRPGTLLRIARALGVEPVDLLRRGDVEAMTLRELRVVRGMSLRELAVAAGTSSSTLRRWESGDFVRAPGADAIRALANALDVGPARVEELLTMARSRAGARSRP